MSGRAADRILGRWFGRRAARKRVAFVDRELGSVATVSGKLALARDEGAVARAILDQVGSLLDTDFAFLALVDEEARTVRGLLGLAGDRELEWASELFVDLEREPSGLGEAVARRVPIPVEDVSSSSIVSRRLAEASGARSAVFVPLLAGERVSGVLVAGTTEERRSFTSDELALLQAVAAEGGLALDRVRSSEALAEALDRERLVARIARKVRSELDLDAVLDVAVFETGTALGVARCFIRLAGPGGELPVEAEWHAPGLPPLGREPERLPASNLAARRRETVVIPDVSTATELDDAGLGRRDALLELGTRSVLAIPIVVFERMIGVFVLHRAEQADWSPTEVQLAEAVTREVGLAVHTARLLRESEQRLDHLSALVTAAQVVSAELRLETVLERLVDELAKLLRADAADCYLLEPGRGVLRCAAVWGLDESLVGLEFPADRGLSSRALAEGKAVVSHDYRDLPDAFPHDSYHGFSAALVAPMVGGREASGVLGVGTRQPERRFGRVERETIEAFGRLAGLALSNAASFEERERRGRVERAFSRVASALAQPLSKAETLDSLAQAACEAFGADASGVWMPASDGLRLAGRYELSPDASNLFEAVPEVLFEAAARGWVLSATRLDIDERFDESFRARAAERFSSLLAIPVESRGASRGLVVVLFAAAQSFTDDDLALASHLAGAATGALERSELFERERRARDLAQRLGRIGTYLSTELDPRRVAAEVVAEAPSLLETDAAALLFVEDDELVFTVATGAGAEAVSGLRTPSTAGLAGEVTQSRAPVAIADAPAQRSPSADPVLEAGYSAYLGVPLTGPEGGVLGVLAVYGRAPRLWRTEEIEGLVALAASASAALGNAELYQRIALEKNRSEAILAHVADGIVAVDREGRVVLWNEAASRITGVDRADALGREPSEVLKRSLDAPEGYDAAASRVVSIPRGGESVWLSVSEAIMRDPAGEIAGRIYAFRDISAERLVEQMKSDFVSTVSHQLRAPLTSIYGFAETLLRHDVDFSDEERRTFLRYVSSESERLTSIVNTLLDVARLDAGDLQVRRVPVDLQSLLRDVVSSVELDDRGNRHEFVLDLPDEPLHAAADDDKLRQVLVNLLDNAVKFSPEGGRVNVSARLKQDAGTVEVAVEDEGMGIPQAEQQLIFSKFYRRSTLAGQEGIGPGLGLFIAEGLLSAMGGSIRVRSLEGRGSSFTFELPLASEAFDLPARQASSSP